MDRILMTGHIKADVSLGKEIALTIYSDNGEIVVIFFASARLEEIQKVAEILSGSNK